MRLRRHVLGALVGSSLLVGQMLAPQAVRAGHPDRPTRILIVILDQARPDTIERYEMTNVQALMEAAGHKKLADYLDDHFGESSKFVSIAQKRTAACTAGHTSSLAGDGTATDPEDIILQIRG